MDAFFIRIVFGSLSLVAVWLAMWPLSAGSYWPMLVAALVLILLSAFSSAAVLVWGRRKKAHIVAFALPFLFFAGISVFDAFGGAWWPLWFSIAGAFVAALVALITDLLIFRLFSPDRKMPNRPPQPTR